MDPLHPTSSSPRRRRQQSPALPVSSPGDLIDAPAPPPGSSAAPRLPLHRRFPSMLRRSPLLPSSSSHAPSPLLPSSSSHAHAWHHTPTDSSAARALHHGRRWEIAAHRPLSFPAIDDALLNSPDAKPLLLMDEDVDAVHSPRAKSPRSPSSLPDHGARSPQSPSSLADQDAKSPQSPSPFADQDVQRSNATAACSITPHEQVKLAGMAMWFRSIVLLFAAVAVIYNEHENPVVMVSELAGILCLYLHFWCSHITQFWMNQPYQEDLSPIVFLLFVMVFMIAFLVGVNYSSYAGMCIMFLATMCMTGLLIGCIREYNCSTRCP